MQKFRQIRERKGNFLCKKKIAEKTESKEQFTDRYCTESFKRKETGTAKQAWGRRKVTAALKLCTWQT